MSFFKKIFSSSSDKDSKNANTPIQLIEDNLGVAFPERFKDFVINKLPKDKEIQIELLDGPYKFLDSLFRTDITNEYEDVVHIANRLNDLEYPEDNASIKIPFAKSTEGDGFKYLYFLSEKNSIATEIICLRDLDSPSSSRIPICTDLSFVIRKAGAIKADFIVSNLSLNYSEVNSWMNIPEYICVWKDSYGMTIREDISEDMLSVELFLTNFTEEDPRENFSKIEVQLTIVANGQRIDSSMAFEVDKAGLQVQFLQNINYRIFYHKLVCIIGTLSTTKDDLKNNHNLNIEDLLNTLDLREITIPEFKETETVSV
jgi:hypothetical protein